jgi:DNA-directed RNA polymerase subunit RPC12/RpoP
MMALLKVALELAVRLFRGRKVERVERWRDVVVCPDCGHRCTYCKRRRLEPSDPPTNPQIRLP